MILCNTIELYGLKEEKLKITLKTVKAIIDFVVFNTNGLITIPHLTI